MCAFGLREEKSDGMLAPRVLIVSPDQWPRALLRAELVEAGYDASGTRSLAVALGRRRHEANREPVRLLILDQSALEQGWPALLECLRSRHAGSPVLLLARGTGTPPAGPWDVVLRRPLTIRRVVDEVRRLVPLGERRASPPPP